MEFLTKAELHLNRLIKFMKHTNLEIYKKYRINYMRDFRFRINQKLYQYETCEKV